MRPVSTVVALDIAPGPRFVETVRRCWDHGEIVVPLPRNVPDAWRAAVIDATAPQVLIGNDGERRSLADGRPGEEGDALVMATSGTSGTPKAVVLTHDALDAAAFASAIHLTTDRPTHWVGCLPLHHIGGFSVVSRAVRCEQEITVTADATEASIRDAVDAGGTHISLVPAMLRRVDPTAFDRILLGGSAIPDDRPPNSIATYGMTESAAGVVYDGLALPGVGVQIDADHQIWLSGHTMMREYRNGSSPFRDGWYPTGDLGSVDPTTGRLEVFGRADDMIVSGGENIRPDTVEDVLRTHPAVADAAVIGRPDERWGQQVVAIVELTAGSSPPTVDELGELVRAVMPRYCAPRAIEVLDELPRTPGGKLRRAELRAAPRPPAAPTN